MNNKWFVGGAVGVAVVGFAVMTYVNKGKATLPTSAPVGQAPVAEPLAKSELAENFVRPHSPRFGNAMARVTVVEWLDPECESCRAMHPVFKKIVAEYSDRVLFVVRYMPYHKGSMFAATALEEARELGKYEEALTLLFEKQGEWGNHHQPRPELIPSYLIKLGVPADRLDEQKLIAKHGDKVRLDQEDGNKVGVEGTPSFFVNEKPVKDLGEHGLRAAIEQELAKVQNN